MSNAWKFQSVPFDPQILSSLEGFAPQDLNDPNSRQVWV